VIILLHSPPVGGKVLEQALDAPRGQVDAGFYVWVYVAASHVGSIAGLMNDCAAGKDSIS
jgi:hypothetical protein